MSTLSSEPFYPLGRNYKWRIPTHITLSGGMNTCRNWINHLIYSPTPNRLKQLDSFLVHDLTTCRQSHATSSNPHWTVIWPALACARVIWCTARIAEIFQVRSLPENDVLVGPNVDVLQTQTQCCKLIALQTSHCKQSENIFPSISFKYSPHNKMFQFRVPDLNESHVFKKVFFWEYRRSSNLSSWRLLFQVKKNICIWYVGSSVICTLM
jgi:hypothetical protein